MSLHEACSPVARLQAAIGLPPAAGADARFLQRIEREGERMNLVVGELLTLSRLEGRYRRPGKCRHGRIAGWHC
ncbi:MAG: hypothetical protein IPL05_20835 [Betaproteobacteria bacterium]|nr:hypothetical protein [Betaproteobacteria bacterium]